MSAESLTIEMTSTCTKAVIEWGDAVRAAEAAHRSGDKALTEATRTTAKLCGMRVLELATRISALLHPSIDPETADG